MMNLIAALHQRKIEEVRMIVDTMNPTFARAWAFGYTLLCSVIEKQQIEIAVLLLEKDIAVNSNDRSPHNTPLHLAVLNNNLELVQMLLSRYANTEAINEMGKTPIFFAVNNLQEEMVKLLISSGANVNCADNDGETPLHMAVHAASVDALHIAKRLLDNGADVNFRIRDCTYQQKASSTAHQDKRTPSRTSLHCAINKGSILIAKVLIKLGANVNIENEEGLNALHFAIKKGQFIILKYILQYCPDINKKSKMGYFENTLYSWGQDNYKIFEQLLMYDFPFNHKDTENEDLWQFVIEKGYMHVIDNLLNVADEHVICNLKCRKGYTLLHLATILDRKEMVELFINLGVHLDVPDDIGKTPISYAVSELNLEIVKLFLAAGVNINAYHLHDAIKRRSKKIVEILLQHVSNMNINAVDSKGETALFLTASHDYILTQIAEMLIKHGADVNAGLKGCMKTTLHTVAENGNALMVKLLLKYNANVNAKQIDGTTPLHLAVENNHGTIIKILLDHGADYDCKKKGDVTPLHIATRKHHADIVKTLLITGADVDSKDIFGKTALRIAVEESCVKMIKILLQYNSDINISEVYFAIKLIPFGSVRDVIASENSFLDYPYREFCGKIICKVPHNFVQFAKSVKILVQHIIKMKVAGLYVSESNLRLVENGIMIDFQKYCIEAVENMKQQKIFNSTISIHDIFRKNVHQLTVFARNPYVIESLRSYRNSRYAEIYYDMIQKRFERGINRYNLLKMGNIYFCSIFFPLPHPCTDIILSYLSDKDLKSLSRAYGIENHPEEMYEENQKIFIKLRY